MTSVEVAVENLDTGQWWDAAAQAWTPTLRWNPAPINPAGGPSAPWTYPPTLPAGRWQLRARARDGAGHLDATPAQFAFRTD